MWNMMRQRVARHPFLFCSMRERTRGHWKSSARYHLLAIKPVRLHSILSPGCTILTSNPFFAGWLIILAHAVSFTFVPMLRRRRRRWTRADGRVCVNYLDGGQPNLDECFASRLPLIYRPSIVFIVSTLERHALRRFGCDSLIHSGERICLGAAHTRPWVVPLYSCVPKGVSSLLNANANYTLHMILFYSVYFN